MSDTPTPETRSLAPWLVLLILPAAAAVGWFVGGKTPIPDAKQAKGAAEQVASTTPAPSLTPVSAAASRDAGATEIRSSVPDAAPESSPIEAEKPQQDEPAGEVSQWTTLELAMAQSERNGKPVLIDFNADWCGPCQRMKKEVFDDWTRGHAIQTVVIPVSIVDRTREEGRNSLEIENLQKKFQIDAFPTLIVFSPASGRAVRTKGYGGGDQTVSWIKQAAKSVR